MINEQTAAKGIRLPKTEITEIERRAKLRSLTFNGWIRNLIKRELKNR